MASGLTTKKKIQHCYFFANFQSHLTLVCEAGTGFQLGLRVYFGAGYGYGFFFLDFGGFFSLFLSVRRKIVLSRVT